MDITRTRCSQVTDEVHRAIERSAQPFVRIDDQRIRAVDAAPQVPALGQDHRRTRPGPHPHATRVHVFAPTARSRYRVDRGGRGRAHRCDDRAGLAPRRQIRGDSRRQRIGAHRMAVVSAHDSRNCPRPKPANNAAFSTELCACALTYTTSGFAMRLQPTAHGAIAGRAFARRISTRPARRSKRCPG